MELFTLGSERPIMLTERKMSAILATASHLQLLQKSPLAEALLLVPHSDWLKGNEGSEEASSDFPDRDNKYIHLPPTIPICFVQTSRNIPNDYERSQNVIVILASKYTKNHAWGLCGCTVPLRPQFIHCDGPFMESAAKYSPGDSALCSCFSSRSWY